MDFSAIGYFFAAEIYQEHNVPIGLISTAVGGTPIEAWIKEETLREIGDYDDVLDKSKDDQWLEKTTELEDKREQDWHQRLNDTDQGMINEWFKPETDTSDWQSFDVPNSRSEEHTSELQSRGH